MRTLWYILCELFDMFWFMWPAIFVFGLAYGICELLQATTKEQKKRAYYYLAGAAFALTTMVAYFR